MMKKLIFVFFNSLMTVVIHYAGEALSDRPDFTRAFQRSLYQVSGIIGCYGSITILEKRGAFDEDSTEKPKKNQHLNERQREKNLETDPVEEIFAELERQQDNCKNNRHLNDVAASNAIAYSLRGEWDGFNSVLFDKSIDFAALRSAIALVELELNKAP
jgi:hypothetical protein